MLMPLFVWAYQLNNKLANTTFCMTYQPKGVAIVGTPYAKLSPYSKRVEQGEESSEEWCAVALIKAADGLVVTAFLICRVYATAASLPTKAAPSTSRTGSAKMQESRTLVVVRPVSMVRFNALFPKQVC